MSDKQYILIHQALVGDKLRITYTSSDLVSEGTVTSIDREHVWFGSEAGTTRAYVPSRRIELVERPSPERRELKELREKLEGVAQELTRQAGLDEETGDDFNEGAAFVGRNASAAIRRALAE